MKGWCLRRAKRSRRSSAFIQGVTPHCPEVGITFDQFHVMKVLGDAVDAVHREERQGRPELAGSRYLRLKNPQDLNPKAINTLANLRPAHLKTGRA